MSYDSKKILKKAAARLKVTFPMLSDPDSKVIDAYGIRQLAYKGKRIDGVPHPMTILIDSKGIARDILAHEGYRKRHSSTDLLEALKKLAAGSKPNSSE